MLPLNTVQPEVMKNQFVKCILPLFLWACFVSFNIPEVSDQCNCTPKEAYRLVAKHENRVHAFPVYPAVIDAQVMNSWKKRYNQLTKTIGRKKADMTKERLKNCPEDSIYRFDGYVYTIASNETDCDLHLECGTKNSRIRVGLEIPFEQCALQNKILNELRAAGFKTSSKKNKPVHIRAKGFGFYDGFHKRWELHPVFEMEVVADN